MEQLIFKKYSVAFESCPFKVVTLNSHLLQNFFQISYYDKILRPYLADASVQYPYFDHWYAKVLDELLYGFRSIVLIYEKSNIAGFSILKHSPPENKICTFYIVQKYRKNNISGFLMDYSLKLLKHKNVLITMPDKKVEAFTPLLNRFGFKLYGNILNYYNKSESEFFYMYNSDTTENTYSRVEWIRKAILPSNLWDQRGGLTSLLL